MSWWVKVFWSAQRSDRYGEFIREYITPRMLTGGAGSALSASTQRYVDVTMPPPASKKQATQGTAKGPKRNLSVAESALVDRNAKRTRPGTVTDALLDGLISAQRLAECIFSLQPITLTEAERRPLVGEVELLEFKPAFLAEIRRHWHAILTNLATIDQSLPRRDLVYITDGSQSRLFPDLVRGPAVYILQRFVNTRVTTLRFGVYLPASASTHRIRRPTHQRTDWKTGAL